MLDLETLASCFIRRKVAFCYWTLLFACSKASDANIGIIANFVYFVKTPNLFQIPATRHWWDSNPTADKVYCWNFAVITSETLVRILVISSSL